MKQIIPFTKDITFKSTIGELTSISLDHDLQLKGEDIISGNFYIKGKYKLTKASQVEEDFSYKIPCEIAISDDYDTYEAVIDIDDFYYEVKENEVLNVNISVCIDNLLKKENEKIEDLNESKEVEERILFDLNEDIEDDNIVKTITNEREEISPINIIQETKQEIFNSLNDNFATYFVYLVQENDTYEKLEERYNCKKDDILLYNDIKELIPGIKLVIPEINNG